MVSTGQPLPGPCRQGNRDEVGGKFTAVAPSVPALFSRTASFVHALGHFTQDRSLACTSCLCEQPAASAARACCVLLYMPRTSIRHAVPEFASFHFARRQTWQRLFCAWVGRWQSCGQRSHRRLAPSHVPPFAQRHFPNLTAIVVVFPSCKNSSLQKVNMVMSTMLASVAEGMCLSDSLGLNNDALIEVQ